MNKQEAHRLLIIRGSEKPITFYYRVNGLSNLVECNSYNEAIGELDLIPHYADIILTIGELELK